jgi:HAD superfamily hydrolase (TIGR01509 family)
MIGAAIFDIDGTLIDSVDAHTQAWVEGFRDQGVDVAYDAVRHQIGKGADQLLPVFLDAPSLKRIGSAIEARQREVFQSRFLNQIQPFPGVRDLFTQLRGDGVKCVLASSGKAAEVARYQEIAGVSGLVDAVATSEDVDRSKPAPDIVEAALKRIAPTPRGGCVFIGDTPYDAEAATRAGVICFGVLSGGFPEDELRAAGCVSVFRNISDLLYQYDVFRGLAAGPHALTG